MKTISNKLLPVKKITKSLRSSWKLRAVKAKQTKAFNKEDETPLIVFEKTIPVFEFTNFNYFIKFGSRGSFSLTLKIGMQALNGANCMIESR